MFCDLIFEEHIFNIITYIIIFKLADPNRCNINNIIKNIIIMTKFYYVILHLLNTINSVLVPTILDKRVWGGGWA